MESSSRVPSIIYKSSNSGADHPAQPIARSTTGLYIQALLRTGASARSPAPAFFSVFCGKEISLTSIAIFALTHGTFGYVGGPHWCDDRRAGAANKLIKGY